MLTSFTLLTKKINKKKYCMDRLPQDKQIIQIYIYETETDICG